MHVKPIKMVKTVENSACFALMITSKSSVIINTDLWVQKYSVKSAFWDKTVHMQWYIKYKSSSGSSDYISSAYGWVCLRVNCVLFSVGFKPFVGITRLKYLAFSACALLQCYRKWTTTKT